MFLLVCLLTFFSVCCLGEETATRRNMVTVGAGLFRSANADYRSVYGQSTFMPEIKISRLVYGGIAIWGSFGWIANNGFIEEVDEKTHIRQTMLSLGLGFMQKLSAPLRLRGELGLAHISFKEEALDVIQKGSGMGWNIGIDLDYRINNKMFVTLTSSYSQASDEVEAGKIELGGLQIGAGLGFIF